MKKKLLNIIKKDLKSDKSVFYLNFNPTIEECYDLYEKEGFTFENQAKVINYLYTSQLKNCIEIGKEFCSK